MLTLNWLTQKDDIKASKLTDAKFQFINPEINDPVFKELQTGYWHLSKGMQRAFRNILSHSAEDKIEVFKQAGIAVADSPAPLGVTLRGVIG